jgi:hypothetical protein
MFNVLKVRLCVTDFGALHPIRKVTSEPIERNTSNAIVLKLVQQNFVVNGVKSLGKVKEDAKSNLFTFKAPDNVID